MNPDSYMPFYGNDFFQAMRGRKAFIKIAYLELIWYYWSHEHCKGLEDDTEFLQGIAGLKDDEWAIAMPVIFDNDHFFTQDSEGRWHQRRAEAEWIKSREKYAAAVKGGQNRWKNVPKAKHAAIGRAGALKQHGS